MSAEGFQTALDLAKAEGKAPLVGNQVAAPLAVRVSGLSADVVEVVRKAVAPKLSEEQFCLYLAICAKRGLDPMTEAYAFSGTDGRLAFGLHIDGMRALAMRTGHYLSRSVETLFDADKKFVGARASIVRQGMTAPVVEEAYLQEYDQKNAMWGKFAETMIRKVAESKALRAAFPDALSGMYEPAEMREERE